ncbi:MAG: sigma-54-dependent Fis family transcriptional regulator [Nitrospirae bacterium]|nr:sigma-54-dependent Fis family transcriptional regulator [Nitrospirota bacterium]
MKLLIADDDKNLRTVLANELSDEGFDVSIAKNGAEALASLESANHDVLLLDMNMPDMSGMDVLKKIKTDSLPTEVIILTAFATVPAAVKAIKLGAYDYLTKPFKIEELLSVVRKAYERKQLVLENISLKTQVRHQRPHQAIITQSPLMLNILEDMKKVARSDVPVLITGESGVGKELVARAIHEASERSDGAFIPINCGAIPENMLESELFGHEKGAFTGALAQKPGLLEVADKGILFFDEIGELPAPLQVKLLRALETQSFIRLGGVREISVDVKFISATNKDLQSKIEEEKFRRDLYYRISAFVLHVPPLRERKEDIPLLINHFIESRPCFRKMHFTDKAMRALSEYPWPGNVRELQNVLHRTLLLSTDEIIDADKLPADIVSGKRPFTSQRIEDVEREHILGVLEAAGGNQKKAAEILGIDPKTLYRKLKSYEVKD